MGNAEVQSELPAVMTSVTVLTGGSTGERDVALAGAAQVVKALRRGAYDVTVVDTVDGVVPREDEARLLVSSVATEAPDPKKLEEWRLAEDETDAVRSDAVRNADVVFLLLHGNQGEGGDIQAQLDELGIKYTGSDAAGSTSAMDKNRAKFLMRDAGVNTPAWVMWEDPEANVSDLGLPVVVKPSRVGSTLGLTIVDSPEEIDAAVAEARLYDDEVMFETFLPGREFTVGVLGDTALGVGEIIPNHRIFDYECKYTPGMSQEIFPAAIDSDLERAMQRLAIEAHRALGLRHFSRIDFKQAEDGTIFCLEANTLPGMTATSLMPQSAAVAGIGFDELCARICEIAIA